MWSNKGTFESFSFRNLLYLTISATVWGEWMTNNNNFGSFLVIFGHFKVILDDLRSFMFFIVFPLLGPFWLFVVAIFGPLPAVF